MYFRRRGSVAECLNHPWIAPKSVGDIRLRQSNQINMDNFRNFQVGIEQLQELSGRNRSNFRNFQVGIGATSETSR